MLSIFESVTPSRVTSFIFRLGPLLQRPMHRAPLKTILSSRWFFLRYSLINITTSLFPLEKQELPRQICISILRAIFLLFKTKHNIKSNNYFGVMISLIKSEIHRYIVQIRNNICFQRKWNFERSLFFHYKTNILSVLQFIAYWH